MSWKIGLDGGGTKTEGILVDPSGAVVRRHTGPGSSPSLLGAAQAKANALEMLRVLGEGHEGKIAATLFCMAGSRAFWRQVADGLTGFGTVESVDDSHPVLELATRGAPGVVLHAGTGSFVAARAQDGSVHYAGGTGWRFGDEGSGYDLGRRAIGRALLEMQGWKPASGIGALVRGRTGATSAAEMSVYFYGDPATNTGVASLAPDVLRLAGEADPAAVPIVRESVTQLLELATAVTKKLFPAGLPADFRAGVSGHILNHPFSYGLLCSIAPFALVKVTEQPIEGVRLLLARIAGRA